MYPIGFYFCFVQCIVQWIFRSVLAQGTIAIIRIYKFHHTKNYVSDKTFFSAKSFIGLDSSNSYSYRWICVCMFIICNFEWTHVYNCPWEPAYKEATLEFSQVHCSLCHLMCVSSFMWIHFGIKVTEVRGPLVHFGHILYFQSQLYCICLRLKNWHEIKNDSTVMVKAKNKNKNKNKQTQIPQTDIMSILSF